MHLLRRLQTNRLGEAEQDEARPPPEQEEARPSLYVDFVKEQVETEATRRGSLETRGTAVLTTSGALVTLLLGLASLVTKSSGFNLPTAVRGPMLAGLALFVLAAGAAIATYAPSRTSVVDAQQLLSEVQQHWNDTESMAFQRITATRISLLASLQNANSRRARLLLFAAAMQALGVLAVAVAVAIVLVKV